MSIKAAIRHRTHYSYGEPVRLGPHIIRLLPALTVTGQVLDHRLTIEAPGHMAHRLRDPYGNAVSRCIFTQDVSELTLVVDLLADMNPINPFDFFLDDGAQDWPFAYPQDIAPDLEIYLRTEPTGSELSNYLANIDRTEKGTLDLLLSLNGTLQKEISYETRLETGVQTPQQTLARKAGSCRDTTWLLIQIFRHLGIAARFVSGYLVQLKTDAVDSPVADTADLHAWAEVYLPGAGWVGLDPTSGFLTAESHIPLAAAPHFSQTAPLTGTASPADAAFDFEITVTRQEEAAGQYQSQSQRSDDP